MSKTWLQVVEENSTCKNTKFKDTTTGQILTDKQVI